MVNALWHFIQDPHSGAVYNIGGSRHSNCSMVEAIAACERLTGRAMNWRYSDESRTGDHIWWISDVRRFQSDYPSWHYRYDTDAILGEMLDGLPQKLKSAGG
jgi:CDP-paratose 2-epimerase